MKRTMIFLMLLGIMAEMSFTQVVVLNYMKVPAGMQDNYVSVENNWKAVHQNLVNEGRMMGWELYYVHNSGTDSKYNFVTANIYKDFTSALAGASMDDLHKAWGDKTENMLKKTMESRNLIYSETIGLQTGIAPKAKQKYLLVTFMNAPDIQTYFDMERTAYLPMHQVAMDEEKMVGWSVWSRMLFDDTEYNAITVNGYNSLDQMAAVDYNAWFRKASMGKSQEEVSHMNSLFKDTNKLRSIVKSQLWELVAETDPKPDGQANK